jgi:membrane protease subunit HflK
VASREQSTIKTTNQEDNQAVPVNLLAVNIPVQFQVTNLQAWITRYTDAGKLLEKIATREVVHYLVSVDINEIMTTSRTLASENLRQRIQAQADEKGLGARIVFVGLQGIHPPTAIAEAYQSVQSAAQAKEAKILEAQGYAARTIPMAKAEAAKRVMQAEAYRERTTANATGQAAKFKHQMAAYDASPEVFSQRNYLSALTRGGNGARKYVIAATNTTDVITLNLEDKFRTDVLDLQLPQTKTK